MIFIDNPNSKEFEESLNWLKERSILALDTETNGLNPFKNKVLLIQVGNEERQYVYDTYKINPRIKELLTILNEGKKYKIIHNAQFDYKMIKGSFGIGLNNLICTYVIEKILTKGKNVSASLKSVTKKYMGIELDKEEQKSFINQVWGSSFTKEQLKYAGIDIVYLLTILEKQKALIREKGIENLVNLELEVLPVIADMSLNGIYLNKTKWLELEQKALKEQKTLEEELKSYFADYFIKEGEDSLFTGMLTPINLNFDSPLQVKKAFEEHLGLAIESTEAKYLVTIKDAHPAIDLLIRYRQSQKLITTYGTKFLENINDLTGRIHSNFKQIDTETGRMSSNEPNLQNIPRSQEYRTPFQVEDEENCRMISADFSGQELRLLAEISGETKFIEAIRDGKDIHSYSASLLYGIPYEQFLEYDQDGNIIMDGDEPKIKKEMKAKYRNPCKTITFGLLYGAGPKKLAAQLNIDLDEAKALQKKYFDTFPKIKNLMDKLVTNMKANKMALSPLDGRFIDFSGIDWDNGGLVAHAMNQAKNLPFQGAGASTTKKALILIDKEIKKRQLDAQIVNCVHDKFCCV